MSSTYLGLDAVRSAAWPRAIPTRSTRPARTASRASRRPTTSRARQARCTPSASASGAPTSCITTRRGAPGVATAFRTAATRLGMDVAGMDEWDRRARDYRRLAQRVRRAGADGVYVAGLCDRRQRRAAHQGSAREARARLPRSSRPTASTNPPRSWRAPARGPRAWSSPSPRSRRRSCRPRACASRGSSSSASAPCRAATRCTAPRRRTSSWTRSRASDGTRAGVLRNLLGTRVRAGLLGDFAIDRYGDTTLTEIAVYRVHGARIRLATTIRPSADLLDRR